MFTARYGLGVSLLVQFSFPSPPVLNTQLHAHVHLTRRANGRSLGTFRNRGVLGRKVPSLSVSPVYKIRPYKERQ